MKKAFLAIAGAFALFAAAGVVVASQNDKDEASALIQANIEALGQGEGLGGPCDYEIYTVRTSGSITNCSSGGLKKCPC